MAKLFFIEKVKVGQGNNIDLEVVVVVIIMIDSITRSFCLRHYVQKGLSYLGKETCV